jgi:hypothetical protein
MRATQALRSSWAVVTLPRYSGSMVRGASRGPTCPTCCQRHARRASDGGPLFLEICHAADGGATITIHHGRANCDRAAELSIVINLRQIFQTCEQKIREREQALRMQMAAMIGTQNRGRAWSERQRAEGGLQIPRHGERYVRAK